MSVRLTRTRAVLTAVGAPDVYATCDDGTAQRGEPYNETSLLFGAERPDGGPAVTDKPFIGFAAKEGHARLPGRSDRADRARAVAGRARSRSGGWTTGPGATSDGMSHVPGRLARENYRR